MQVNNLRDVGSAPRTNPRRRKTQPTNIRPHTRAMPHVARDHAKQNYLTSIHPNDGLPCPAGGPQCGPYAERATHGTVRATHLAIRAMRHANRIPLCERSNTHRPRRSPDRAYSSPYGSSRVEAPTFWKSTSSHRSFASYFRMQ